MPQEEQVQAPFAHADMEIRQELTDDTIAAINKMSISFRQKLLRDKTDYYGGDDFAPPPWLASPDRAS